MSNDLFVENCVSEANAAGSSQANKLFCKTINCTTRVFNNEKGKPTSLGDDGR